MPQPHILILGAGIGGLTVAHELAKRGITSTVLERNDTIGGLARSAYATDGTYRYPVEYSWRVYGTQYRNLHRLLGEIPLADESDKTVRDNLVKWSTYMFPREKIGPLIYAPEGGEGSPQETFTTADSRHAIEKILATLTMSTQRMDAMDDVAWHNYCADLSPEAKKYLVKIWGPVLGMDPLRVSFPAVARLFPVVLGAYLNRVGPVFLMNKPTNEGWFNHWKAYLLGTGNVTIKTGIEVKDILLRGNRVDRVVVHDVKTNKTSHITVDDVVCSMGVEAIADIVARNPHLKDVPTFGRIPELARIGRQTQLSIQLFLNTRIRYPTQQAPIAYLPDSPWALIIEDQTVVWENDHSTDPRIQSLLSVGICETDAPGIVYSKPFTRCTREEIRNEVVEQIRRSYTGSGIHLNDGTQFSNDNIVQFYLWDSFAYDERTMRMDTWEPKFSNNAGTLRLMPQTKTEIENLYFATGYTKTSRFLYSMEAAVEAGTRAANAVLRRAQPGTKPTRIHPMKRILGPFAPLVWMDRVLFRLGVPYLGTALASSVVLVGLYITLIITAIIVLIISLVIFL